MFDFEEWVGGGGIPLMCFHVRLYECVHRTGAPHHAGSKEANKSQMTRDMVMS